MVLAVTYPCLGVCLFLSLFAVYPTKMALVKGKNLFAVGGVRLAEGSSSHISSCVHCIV